MYIYFVGNVCSVRVPERQKTPTTHSYRHRHTGKEQQTGLAMEFCMNTHKLTEGERKSHTQGLIESIWTIGINVNRN